MPAYNEEANIEDVVRQWYPILIGKNEKARLVIADSGSTDKTHDLILDLQKEFTQLEILNNTGKQHGPKVIALYKYAIANGADYIFQTDSDGQTDPAEFDTFWEMRSDYSGIFGNRTARGDGKQRAFVERVVCTIVRLYFGVKIPDANAPFRLMKAETVNKYIDNLPDDYNLPNIMLTSYFAYYGEKIFFKPISFKPRQGGTNSIDISKIVKIGIKALGDFNNFRKKL